MSRCERYNKPLYVVESINRGVGPVCYLRRFEQRAWFLYSQLLKRRGVHRGN